MDASTTTVIGNIEMLWLSLNEYKISIGEFEADSRISFLKLYVADAFKKPFPEFRGAVEVGDVNLDVVE